MNLVVQLLRIHPGSRFLIPIQGPELWFSDKLHPYHDSCVGYGEGVPSIRGGRQARSQSSPLWHREDNAKSLSRLNTLGTDSIPSQLCYQHLLANWYKESVILLLGL